jgi:hypothetical protein
MPEIRIISLDKGAPDATISGYPSESTKNYFDLPETERHRKCIL